MATIKEVIIHEVDLKKLMKKAGIASLRQLAEKAQVNYEHLVRVNNGHFSMTPEYWEKIKIVLNKYN